VNEVADLPRNSATCGGIEGYGAVCVGYGIFIRVPRAAPAQKCVRHLFRAPLKGDRRKRESENDLRPAAKNLRAIFEFGAAVALYAWQPS
jgi:hypothetical protein